MPRPKSEDTPVHRTDLLPSNLTASKRRDIANLVHAYRTCTVLAGRQQQSLFYRTGAFDKNNCEGTDQLKAIIGGTRRAQMCRYQAAGQLQSWLSNRRNECRHIVQGHTFRDERPIKHMLHYINQAKAWFKQGELSITINGVKIVIPQDIRRLARTIMHKVISRHRLPDLRYVSMRLDRRAADVVRPRKATQDGRVDYWVRMDTLDGTRKVEVPLLMHKQHRQRVGKLAGGIQVNLSREGRMSFGLVTDEGAAYAASRDAYQGKKPIALDFGLTTMFATSEGQLLGQGFLTRLRGYDTQMQHISVGQKRRGLKPRQSKRYVALVGRVRGYIKTEVGRVLNRLLSKRKPSLLVLEQLDFRDGGMSRQLNRIISNCGRSVIKQKLADIEQRFGVVAEEVMAAYSSQTCRRCDYVDGRNRSSQSKFRCLFCGHRVHADVNAAGTLLLRRNMTKDEPGLSRGQGWSGVRSIRMALRESVRRFTERHGLAVLRLVHNGGSGSSADALSDNPYLRDWLAGQRSPTLALPG